MGKSDSSAIMYFSPHEKSINELLNTEQWTPVNYSNKGKTWMDEEIWTVHARMGARVVT
jgi:hypothetical protein